MDLNLVRLEFLPDGIFGELRGDGVIMHTLEHAYQESLGIGPKVPDGSYVCARGMHRLRHMTQPFETFEITNVPGHTNILFHIGNFNFDSEGCVLLGMAIARISGQQALGSSKFAFEKFMSLQEGCDNFMLTVSRGQ